MRNILIGVFLVFGFALNARDMFVVVHVSERVVVHYVCKGNILSEGALLQKSIVSAPGRVSWHVVGGVAPYTMIDQRVENGVIFITVIDAAGVVAGGSATLRVRDEIVLRDCYPKEIEYTEAELAQIQDEQIRKARAERDALRGDEPERKRVHPLVRAEGKRGGGGRNPTLPANTQKDRGGIIRTGGGNGGGTLIMNRYLNTSR